MFEERAPVCQVRNLGLSRAELGFRARDIDRSRDEASLAILGQFQRGLIGDDRVR